MSVHIPFDIQMKIIKMVFDVKSLIRFRAVSKPWRSYIDSSEFIAGYRPRKTQPHSLLLRHTNIEYPFEVKYQTIYNDTLTQQQDLAPNVSAFMKQCPYLIDIGYSRGLLCLHTSENGGILVLWNPSLRRCVGIFEAGYYCEIFGFAVCPLTNEPTIVKISCAAEVEIFTLSSKRWTEIRCSMPLKVRKSIKHLDGYQVVIGSCIYRVVCEIVCLPNGCLTDQYMIVSFDLIAREFKAIDLPDTLTNPHGTPLGILLSKIKGSLVVTVPDTTEVKVWKMEPDCSFTELFTINTPDYYICKILRFWKNGEIIVETQDRDRWNSALEVYDPFSKRITNLGMPGKYDSVFISSYKETLLLLDHPDSCEYPEIN